jgi:hypothetical protein
MSIMKKLKGNLQTYNKEKAAREAAMPEHWDRFKKEPSLHTGQNIITESHRIAPYSWAHLFPIHALVTISLLIAVVVLIWVG